MVVLVWLTCNVNNFKQGAQQLHSRSLVTIMYMIKQKIQL
jgi:hypothetical protein